MINAFSSPDAIRNLLPPAGGTAVDGSFIKLEQSGTYQIKALSTSVTMAVLKLSNYHPTNAVLICDNTPQKEALSVGWSVGWPGNAFDDPHVAHIRLLGFVHLSAMKWVCNYKL